MVAALDAIVLALAPAFAAGFAIQKQLEVFDAVFSWSADWIAKLLDERLQEASDEGKKSTKAINGIRSLIKPLTGYINSREITKAQGNPPANGNVSLEAGTGKPKAANNFKEAGQEVQTEEGTERGFPGKAPAGDLLKMWCQQVGPACFLHSGEDLPPGLDYAKSVNYVLLYNPHIPQFWFSKFVFFMKFISN